MLNTHYLRTQKDPVKLTSLREIIWQSTSSYALMDMDAIHNSVKCFYYANNLVVPEFDEIKKFIKELAQEQLLEEIAGTDIIYKKYFENSIPINAQTATGGAD